MAPSDGVTPPAEAAARFAAALGLGCLLGLWYGFLRPLRPRHTGLSDLAFVAGGFYAWLELSFRVCRGDLRLGYTAGLFLGCFLLDRTLGKPLAPFFRLFWKAIGKIWFVLTYPLKKFLGKLKKIIKNIFSFGKKSFTIRWNMCRLARHGTGGKSHGESKRRKRKVRTKTQQHSDEDRGVAGGRIVYGDIADP